MSGAMLPLELGVLDLGSGTIGGTSIRLTKTERKLLAYLAGVGRSCGPEELLTEVWGYREGVRSRTVYSTVNRVRTKIERDARAPAHLVNDEQGYRFVPLHRRAGPELVGRDHALGEVLGRLAEGPVAVVGPGGIGKTALAQALVATSPLQTGLWVDLRDVEDPTEARGCIADALGLEGDEIEASLEMRGPMLLVLDDLDLLEDRGALVEPLLGVPGLQLLCTCRGAIPGCASFELPPLDRDAARTLLTANSARAHAEDDLDALGEQLGRLPLALCLASQWLDALGTQVFATDPLQLPGLRGSIERSWGRVAPAARQLLAGLAELGSSVPVELLLRLGGLDELAQLTGLSLVRADDGWIEISAPVRAFAREHPAPPQLFEQAASWARETTCGVRRSLFTPRQPEQIRRFRRARPLVLSLVDRLDAPLTADLLVDLVEVALHTGAVRGLEPRVARALAAVDPPLRWELELQQTRLRLVLAGRTGQQELELDRDALPEPLGGRYGHYRCSLALQRGELDEALAWVERELDVSDPFSVLHRRLVFCRAKVHRRRGEVKEALAWLQELEVLSVEAEDPVHRMTADALVGSIAKQQGRSAEAEASLSRARDLAAQLELDVNHAHLTVALAQVFAQSGGDGSRARELLEEAEAYYLRTGQRRSLGYVQLTLASLGLYRGDATEAVRAARAAVRHFERSEDRLARGYARGTLARILVAFGETRAAGALLDELLQEPTDATHPVLEALRALNRRASEGVVPVPGSMIGHPAEGILRRLLRPGTPREEVCRWLASPGFERDLGLA